MKLKASIEVFLDPKLKKRDEKMILASSFSAQTNKQMCNQFFFLHEKN